MGPFTHQFDPTEDWKGLVKDAYASITWSVTIYWSWWTFLCGFKIRNWKISDDTSEAQYDYYFGFFRIEIDWYKYTYVKPAIPSSVGEGVGRRKILYNKK